MSLLNRMAKDASCSMNDLQCDHRMAIEGIKRGQELTNQLRDALGFAATSEPVSKLFNGLHSSLYNALSGIQCACNASSSKSQKRKKHLLEEDNQGVNLKRRNIEASIVTTTPHYDGLEWRKYGEKHINGSRHERCYYRCTYSTELKCPAKKTIQREDGSTDPPVYSVIYYNCHTCNYGSGEHTPFVIDSSNFSKEDIITRAARQKAASFEDHERQMHHSGPSSVDFDMLRKFGMETDQH
ncbi:putative WRKY transcription factor 70 [Carex littledalei]|uniref:Putative WRKY transcription factor 70 n=1 Tax=Carex littledalei TaxID=544730 RepID=A0A833QE83_9POAL|nr:putative WRKY transcription factor 70 [Carex littledalei]